MLSSASQRKADGGLGSEYPRLPGWMALNDCSASASTGCAERSITLGLCLHAVYESDVPRSLVLSPPSRHSPSFPRLFKLRQLADRFLSSAPRADPSLCNTSGTSTERSMEQWSDMHGKRPGWVGARYHRRLSKIMEAQQRIARRPTRPDQQTIAAAVSAACLHLIIASACRQLACIEIGCAGDT